MPARRPGAGGWSLFCHIVPGVFTPVLAKHSKSFSLIDCISVGVDRMQRNFEPMRKQVETWQRSELTDVTAKVVIYEAFVEGKLEAGVGFSVRLSAQGRGMHCVIPEIRMDSLKAGAINCDPLSESWKIHTSSSSKVNWRSVVPHSRILSLLRDQFTGEGTTELPDPAVQQRSFLRRSGSSQCYSTRNSQLARALVNGAL